MAYERKLWLEPIEESLREEAVARLNAGNVSGFLHMADNTTTLTIVARNVGELLNRGLYEEALLHAFVSTRGNHAKFPHLFLRFLFNIADRPRLLAAGSPLPGPGPFTVYRGVSGRTAARRVRSISWTSSLETARWFANRLSSHLPDPVVFSTVISARDVLAYVDRRHEQEFLVVLPPDNKPKRVVDASPSEGTLELLRQAR